MFFLLISSVCFSQRAVEKIYTSEGITLIDIDAEHVFQVKLSTHSAKNVEVKTIFNGEYQNEFVNTTKEDGTTLFIGVAQQPLFTNPNDKLSAHKVVSVALEIIVPAYKDVRVLGVYTEISAEGNYTNLETSTASGMLFFNSINADLVKGKTQSGDILIENSAGNFQAISKYGTVEEGKQVFGNTKFELNSVSGDIYINNIE